MIRYRFSDFTLSPQRRLLVRDGREVPLIPRYFDLLVLLIERRHEAVGLPVVPIAVDSGLAYGGFVKKGGTITYRIGEPIPPGLPREEIEARVHAAINALNLEA